MLADVSLPKVLLYPGDVPHAVSGDGDQYKARNTGRRDNWIPDVDQRLRTGPPKEKAYRPQPSPTQTHEKRCPL